MILFNDKLPMTLEEALSRHEKKWGKGKPEFWSSAWEKDALELQSIMREERDAGNLSVNLYKKIQEYYFGNILCQFIGHNPEHERDALRWLCSPEMQEKMKVYNEQQ